jgi:2,4-dienoyl-CoA reductase-like NADH-dependent reductase (Old Yellow Enzyme family)
MNGLAIQLVPFGAAHPHARRLDRSCADRAAAEYYAQRASAGLIVAEATAISPDGFGWAETRKL